MITLPSNSSLPEVISSRPASMRRTVDFPQPVGSHKDDKLAVIHIQIEIMDGMKPIGIHLVYILKLYFSHLYASIIYWFGCASCFCSRRRLELLRRLLPPAANNKAAPARLATRMICSRS